jgi:hypothetical protein
MGLGSLKKFTLEQFREEVHQGHIAIRAGRNPLAEKHERDAALMASAAQSSDRKTVEWCCEEYIRAKASGWKSLVHHRQWTASMKEYVYPRIGSLAIARVDDSHAEPVLMQAVGKDARPLWIAKHQTASTRTRVARESHQLGRGEWLSPQSFPLNRASRNPAARSEAIRHEQEFSGIAARGDAGIHAQIARLRERRPYLSNPKPATNSAP